MLKATFIHHGEAYLYCLFPLFMQFFNSLTEIISSVLNSEDIGFSIHYDRQVVPL